MTQILSLTATMVHKTSLYNHVSPVAAYSPRVAPSHCSRPLPVWVCLQIVPAIIQTPAASSAFEHIYTTDFSSRDHPGLLLLRYQQSLQLLRNTPTPKHTHTCTHSSCCQVSHSCQCHRPQLPEPMRCFTILNLDIFVNFSVFSMSLNSSFISLWLKKLLNRISVFSNSLRFVL